MSIYWNPMVPELTVTDFERSLHFYVDIVGFSIRIRRHTPEFAYLCMNDVQLMIEQWHPEGWNIGEFEWPLGRGINFQIEVDNVDSLSGRFESSQVALYRPVKEHCYHTNEGEEWQRELLVQDPDGYLLRFSQYLG